METTSTSWTQVFPGGIAFSRNIDCDLAEWFWGVKTIWIVEYWGSETSRSYMIVAWED